MTKFRDTGMTRVYDACTAAYAAKGAAYMAEGNSAAVMFKRGFTGQHVGKWDAESRKTTAYAAFRAGQDCAKKPAKKKPGRPELPPDERRERTIRIRATESEEAKFARIGGALWFRAALKRAKET